THPKAENTTTTRSPQDTKHHENHPPPATPQQSFARPMAGAHPSLRLDRPEENTDIFEIDDLPEVEDLDQAEDLDDTPTGLGGQETTEQPPGPPRTPQRSPRSAHAPQALHP